jgi:hypothetical protein
MEDFDISKPALIFFGTEETDFKEILQRADGFFKIPW